MSEETEQKLRAYRKKVRELNKKIKELETMTVEQVLGLTLEDTITPKRFTLGTEKILETVKLDELINIDLAEVIGGTNILREVIDQYKMLCEGQRYREQYEKKLAEKGYYIVPSDTQIQDYLLMDIFKLLRDRGFEEKLKEFVKTRLETQKQLLDVEKERLKAQMLIEISKLKQSGIYVPTITPGKIEE